MTQITEVFRIKSGDVIRGLDQALSAYKVAALVKRGERIMYDYIANSSEIISYQPTVVSPKKFFFPKEEVLLEYTNDGKVTPKIKAEPQVLFGITPCDINGLLTMDEAFAESKGDPNYLARREQTIVIGMDCKAYCDKDAFCSKVKTETADSGFDVMLHRQGDDYLVTIGTEKGRKFMDKYIPMKKADLKELEEFKKQKAQAFAKEPPFKNLEQFPDLFEKNKNHPVWDKEGKRCLSCGSCIMVCPTCYCFDVADEMKLNLQKGERVRRWDACMLHDFTLVAGGEVFRHSATGRLHHRINRKFEYLMRKHKRPVCVGCGRCVRACLAEISPKTIAEAINGEKEVK